MSTNETFFMSAQEEPHKSRSQEIIKKHPEVAQLISRSSITFLLLVLVVSLQLTLAWWLGKQGLGKWWLAVLTAFVLGAFANHALYVIIHEACHNLIFKKRLWNKIAGVLADVPNVFPGALAFRNYHIKHHAYMGDHDFDADLPNTWEADLVKNIWWRKMIWLFLFPFMQVTRSFFTRKVKTFQSWVLINLIVIVLADVLIVYFFGWNAIIYLLFSMVFALGLHPLGARWIQEHYTIDGKQETFSYYGPLNILALNVGYHNEHHDFPSIPWNKLPKLKKIAPEYYDSLAYHTSWTGLLFKFLFNKEYSLYSRIIRGEENIKKYKSLV